MKYNRYKVFGFALVSMVAFSACSDSFLDDKMKRNYLRIVNERIARFKRQSE